MYESTRMPGVQKEVVVDVQMHCHWVQPASGTAVGELQQTRWAIQAVPSRDGPARLA